MNKIKTILSNLKTRFLNNAFFVQLGHGAGGYGMLITPLAIEAVRAGLPVLRPLLEGVAIVLIWSIPKEYVFDVLVEKATLADGWIDQRSYLIGALVGAAVVLLALL